MFKIDELLWSRNRGCQLDLNLRSTKEYFKNVGTVFVLWKADNEKFKQGYEKVMQTDYGLNIEFIQEANFEDDIKDILNNKMQTEYVLGNSDDNVFIKEIDFRNFNLSRRTVAFSLRLGESINYCLPADLDLEYPEFILDFDQYLMWKWIHSDSRGGWGYPYPVDSHIYSRAYWMGLLEYEHFNNPKEMEDCMNESRNPHRPYLMSFKEPHLVSISANELGQGSDLINQGIGLSELNERFLNDDNISTDNIYGIDVNSCHIFLDYQWENKNCE